VISHLKNFSSDIKILFSRKSARSTLSGRSQNRWSNPKNRMWGPRIWILLQWIALLLQNFLNAFKLCLGDLRIAKIYLKNIFRLSYGSFFWVESFSQNSLFSAPDSTQYGSKWLKKGFSGNHSTWEMIHSGAKKYLYNIFLLLSGLEDIFAKLWGSLGLMKPFIGSKFRSKVPTGGFSDFLSIL